MKKIVVCSLALVFAGAISLRAADAKAIWDKDCAKCHGADGAGKTKMGEKLGARDFTDSKVQAEMKDEAMTKGIKQGVKDKSGERTLMKAFPELSDAEIKSLVSYVRSLKK